LAALYLYRCPLGRWSLEIVATALGIKVKSMRMRVSNHRAIDTGEGLGHFSAKSRRVFEAFGSLSCSELEAALLARIPALRDATSRPNGGG